MNAIALFAKRLESGEANRGATLPQQQHRVRRSRSVKLALEVVGAGGLVDPVHDKVEDEVPEPILAGGDQVPTVRDVLVRGQEVADFSDWTSSLQGFFQCHASRACWTDEN